MKQLIRLTILVCSCAALALTVVAGPEPLPSGKEMKEVAPVPECDFNWTGFYIGINYGDVDYSANTDFGSGRHNGITYPVSFSQTNVGWTAGAGIEYAVGHHWTVKAEYLYYDLGDESRTGKQTVAGVPQGPPFFVHYNFDTSGNIVRGGLNFKF